MAKKAVLGMKAFYKAVIKDLQKKLQIEGVPLRALTCLNPLDQKAADSFQHLLPKNGQICFSTVPVQMQVLKGHLSVKKECWQSRMCQ